MNTALKVAVVALAVVGALALIAAAGMATMHFSMMGGFGC